MRMSAELKLRMMLLCAAWWAAPQSLSLGCGHVERSHAEAAYSATGTIKSFGPERAFVNIAHEAIPGYMGAMTMSFEPSSAGMLSSFAAGQRVMFQFRETPDGRRVIVAIRAQ